MPALRLPEIKPGSMNVIGSLGRYDTRGPARAFAAESASAFQEISQIRRTDRTIQGIKNRILSDVVSFHNATVKSEIDKAKATFFNVAEELIQQTPEFDENETPIWKNADNVKAKIINQAKKEALKKIGLDHSRAIFDDQSELWSMAIESRFNQKVNKAQYNFIKTQTLTELETARQSRDLDKIEAVLKDPDQSKVLTPRERASYSVFVREARYLNKYNDQVSAAKNNPLKALELKNQILEDEKLPLRTKNMLISTIENNQIEQFMRATTERLRITEKNQGVFGAYNYLRGLARQIQTMPAEQLGGDEEYRQKMLGMVMKRASQYKQLYEISFRKVGESLSLRTLASGQTRMIRGVHDKLANKLSMQILFGTDNVAAIDRQKMFENDGAALKKYFDWMKQTGNSWLSPLSTKVFNDVIQSGSIEEKTILARELLRTTDLIPPDRLIPKNYGEMRDFVTFLRYKAKYSDADEEVNTQEIQQAIAMWDNLKSRDPAINKRLEEEAGTQKNMKWFKKNFPKELGEHFKYSPWYVADLDPQLTEMQRIEGEELFKKWYQFTGDKEQALNLATTEMARHYSLTNIGGKLRLTWRPASLVVSEATGGNLKPNDLLKDEASLPERLGITERYGVEKENVEFVNISNNDRLTNILMSRPDIQIDKAMLKAGLDYGNLYAVYATDPDTGMKRLLNFYIIDPQEFPTYRKWRTRKAIDAELIQKQAFTTFKQIQYHNSGMGTDATANVPPMDTVGEVTTSSSAAFEHSILNLFGKPSAEIKKEGYQEDLVLSP